MTKRPDYRHCIQCGEPTSAIYCMDCDPSRDPIDPREWEV